MVINYKINFCQSLINLKTNHSHYNQFGTHFKEIKLNKNYQILKFEEILHQ
jgi:hypothetical protein